MIHRREADVHRWAGCSPHWRGSCAQGRPQVEKCCGATEIVDKQSWGTPCAGPSGRSRHLSRQQERRARRGFVRGAGVRGDPQTGWGPSRPAGQGWRTNGSCRDHRRPRLSGGSAAAMAGRRSVTDHPTWDRARGTATGSSCCTARGFGRITSETTWAGRDLEGCQPLVTVLRTPPGA